MEDSINPDTNSYKQSLLDAKSGLNFFMKKIANLPKIFMENMTSEYGTDYKNIFEHNLLRAKGGLIVFLILITLIYHVNYGKRTYSMTYIQSSFRSRAILDAIFTGFIGFIATSFIMYTRNGSVLNHLKGPIIVFIVLALFNFVQESSGFNRFLNRTNIEEGKSNYAIIDNILTTEGVDQLQVIKEQGGDPFINSIGYFSMIIIGLLVLSKIFTMLISTYFGFKSGNHSIDKIVYKGLTAINSNNTKFIIELLVLGGLNAISPLVSPFIRKDVYNVETYGISFFIFLIAVSLHGMFQWTGNY